MPLHWRRLSPLRAIGYIGAAPRIEKQEETKMRLKLLSPGEMNADQKQTYDEAIAGKRGAPPAPMMAWLNSPEMARHATRLGETLRFNTMFPAKLSEIARAGPRMGSTATGLRSPRFWVFSILMSRNGERLASWWSGIKG